MIVGFALGLVSGYLRYSVGELFPFRSYGWLAFAAQLVDGAPLDALLPLGAYALIRRCGRSKRPYDANEAVSFSLAWLAPLCGFRAVYWSAVPDPVRLMIIPILFVFLSVSMPYWIQKVLDEFGLSQAAAVVLVIAAPLVSAAATWALLTQRLILGTLFLCLAAAAAFPSLKPEWVNR